MASPQCEDGYTKLANELLEGMIGTRIPGQEMRVVLAIIRLTYGYGKKSDKISYGQIAKLLNIPRVRTIKHVKSLVSKKILGSLNHGTRQPSTIWINKDFEKWKSSPIKGTSPKEETRDSPLIETKSSPNQGTHQRKKKLKEKYNIDLPDSITPALWEDFKDHRKKIRKPMTKRAEDIMIKKLMRFEKDHGHSPEDLIELMIEKGWQSIELDWIKGKHGKQGNGTGNAKSFWDGVHEGSD